LAVVHTKDAWATWALFSSDAVRAGDTAVAMGFPLAGVLADTANVTVGNVSALAGPYNDSRFLQITTPIQPGNSGGGLFDANGGIIGVVQSTLDVTKIFEIVGDIPQNVNFAIKAETARGFLSSNRIKFQMSPNLGRKLSPTDVGGMARPFTVRIECYGKQQEDDKIPQHPVQTTKPQFPNTALPSPQPQSSEPPLSGGCIGCNAPQNQPQQNYYRVTQNLMLRAAPTKYSANMLAPYAPNDFIPESSIFSYWPFHCTYGSGMYSPTNEVWCSVEYQHDGGIGTRGWVSAHFLRDNYGNLLACRYATPDPECTDPRYPRYWDGSNDVGLDRNQLVIPSFWRTTSCGQYKRRGTKNSWQKSSAKVRSCAYSIERRAFFNLIVGAKSDANGNNAIAGTPSNFGADFTGRHRKC
jgi:hypothetical protein